MVDGMIGGDNDGIVVGMIRIDYTQSFTALILRHVTMISHSISALLSAHASDN